MVNHNSTLFLGNIFIIQCYTCLSLFKNHHQAFSKKAETCSKFWALTVTSENTVVIDDSFGYLSSQTLQRKSQPNILCLELNSNSSHIKDNEI
jgi:hypothetical protein